MTLADILPSIGRLTHDRLPAGVWPAGTTLDADGDLVVGGVSLGAVAAAFGTPVAVLDEEQVRARCREYRRVLGAHLGEVEISYAGKALLTRAVARWVHEEGLGLDTCSAGELAVARAAGVPGERITVHGNAKTPEDLKAALAAGAGRIVLDSVDDIERVAALCPDGQRVLIRVTPGVDGHTHRAVNTGVDDQKFGFCLTDGAAADAVRRVLAHPNLRLAGLHTHLGSQLCSVASFTAAAQRLVALLGRIRDEHRCCPPVLNLGGGHAVAYRAGECEFDLAGFAERVRRTLAYECAAHRLPMPRLAVEPGRAIVARAGVSAYRVLAVKRQAGGRTFVAVDGGMSDNARPALYGSGYTVRLIGRHSAAGTRPVTIAGRHCEAGDLLAEDVELPADVAAGDLLAFACTGAYHVPLASNYNLVPRPPLIAVRDGHTRPLLRRETEEDLAARDVGW